MRSAETGPKRENVSTGINRLVISFDGKTYKSGKYCFLREQESKDDTDSFIKVATDVVFKQIYAEEGINKFGEKEVAAIVKEYRQIYKGPMEGNTVVTPIDTDTLSYEYRRKAL